MANRPDVLILGGGVIGLTAAYFLARDGVRDRIDCGAQADTVVADRFDRVAANCEHVQRLR